MMTSDRSHMETEDGISDGSMRKAQRIVDAVIAQGARLSIRWDDGGGAWVTRLSTGAGPEMFTVMAPGLTQRLVLWALGMKILSRYYPRFLTREQLEAVIGETA